MRTLGSIGFAAGLWFKLGRTAILGNLSAGWRLSRFLVFMFAGFQVCQQPGYLVGRSTARFILGGRSTIDHTVLKRDPLADDDRRDLGALLRERLLGFDRDARADRRCIEDNDGLLVCQLT